MADPDDDKETQVRSYKDVGGTSGGFGEFVLGAALLGLGGYILLNHVVVSGGQGAVFGRSWTIGFSTGGAGFSPFGVMLALLFIGVIILFWNGRSVAGWILTAGASLGIFAAIISDLHLYFQPTTLFMTLAMFGLIASGIGLVFRAIMPHH